MKTRTLVMIAAFLTASIFSCGGNSKQNDKITAYTQDTFNGMLNNDENLFYSHFLSSEDYEKSDKKMRPVKENRRSEVLSYFNNKLKKRVGTTDGIKLTHIIIQEPKENQAGEIDLIYKDKNGQYYDFHYFKFINMGDEIYFSIGNDDFNKIDPDKRLSEVKKNNNVKIIELD